MMVLPHFSADLVCKKVYLHLLLAPTGRLGSYAHRRASEHHIVRMVTLPRTQGTKICTVVSSMYQPFALITWSVWVKPQWTCWVPVIPVSLWKIKTVQHWYSSEVHEIFVRGLRWCVDETVKYSYQSAALLVHHPVVPQKQYMNHHRKCASSKWTVNSTVSVILLKLTLFQYTDYRLLNYFLNPV